MTPPDAGPTLLPCPFCDEHLMQTTLINGNRVWEHSLDTPCVCRGLAISEEGSALWNNRRAPGEREAALERENEDLREMMRGVATQLNAAAGPKIPLKDKSHD